MYTIEEINKDYLMKSIAWIVQGYCKSEKELEYLVTELYKLHIK